VAGFQVDERAQVIAFAILVEHVVFRVLDRLRISFYLVPPFTSRFILPAF
jgi:hypothetical protein